MKGSNQPNRVPDSVNFYQILRKSPFFESLESEVASKIIKKMVSYREEVLLENKVQNLTRILDPEPFYEKNIVDVVAFHQKINCRGQKVMDLGSGGGVPGVIGGILNLLLPDSEKNHWILVESEGRKAQFLHRTINRLHLEQIEVFEGRGEAYLKENRVDTVVSRAVGSIYKVYSLIRKCSTWNTLVFFKGEQWEKEWEEFKKSEYSTQIDLTSHFHYGESLSLSRCPPKKTLLCFRRNE